MKKGFLFLLLGLCLALLAACGQQMSFEDSEPQVSVDNIPDEPSVSELEDQLKQSTTNDIEALISNNFFLLDVVDTDNGSANIYATRRFTVPEMVELLREKVKPEEISDIKNNQQILAYPDQFVSVKQSEEDSNVTIIEVANDEFVRNHYSPSFLNTYFSYVLLSRLLDVDDWDRRRRQCQDGGCYGGYTTGTSTNRGMSGYRGGGPGSGK
ncbi:DUF4247 domain-containing protein [Radiobacillus kanasensis]|uniref:DUF4247 domain-containing protein n=1 Tax=Radiobacillus kanasensis TaxID=2844358 RepID=UPI001E3E6423|nr:DUF4247 domain-containing protein [Radiobacillus kanasensis]UFU01401.1 DUF4247 domain-containing protein [Radiobacillus kanasensis]